MANTLFLKSPKRIMALTANADHAPLSFNLRRFGVLHPANASTEPKSVSHSA